MRVLGRTVAGYESHADSCAGRAVASYESLADSCAGRAVAGYESLADSCSRNHRQSLVERGEKTLRLGYRLPAI